MLKSFTFWLTFGSVAVCLLNYAGLDRNNMLLYHISVPVWFIETFRDIHSMSILASYAMTVASFAVLGLFIDGLNTRRKRKAY